MENPNQFSSIEEECQYWRELARLYRKEKVDVQKEFEDFTEESRQLEQELETTLIQNEKQLRDASQTIDSLREENQTLRQRLTTFEREAIGYETKISKLNTECDTMKTYIRDLEQKNDDLERTNRVVSESVAGFETMLNQAYEKNALLEMEMDEKEQMQTNLQRLMDEARDLKQELKIRNIAIPKKLDSDCEDEPMDTSASPSKNHLPKKDQVCRLNDINDSRNNNSFMTNSMRSSTVNNSSLNDTTILNNMTFENSISTPSHNNNNNNTTSENPMKSQTNAENLSKSSQPNSNSILKYDCAINSNPIAASTRVSALNIVADLLKKLDNLEAKLKSWKTQKSPTQRIIISDVTATFNNNEKSISIENLDRK